MIERMSKRKVASSVAVALLALPATAAGTPEAKIARGEVKLSRHAPAKAMKRVMAKLEKRGHRRDVARLLAATGLANGLAPYGQSSTRKWKQLRAEPVLDCDNYASAAAYLYHFGGGRKQVRMFGFDHGPFGNHAQLKIGAFVLDPTIGLVARAPGFLRGRKARHLYPAVGRFRREYQRALVTQSIRRALKRGQYRRWHVIYNVEAPSW